jgi:hypothetical protein
MTLCSDTVTRAHHTHVRLINVQILSQGQPQRWGVAARELGGEQLTHVELESFGHLHWHERCRVVAGTSTRLTHLRTHTHARTINTHTRTYTHTRTHVYAQSTHMLAHAHNRARTHARARAHTHTHTHTHTHIGSSSVWKHRTLRRQPCTRSPTTHATETF